MSRSEHNRPKLERASASDEVRRRKDISSSPAPTHDEIAREAYSRYLAHGAQDGRDEEDWLEAERALRSQNGR